MITLTKTLITLLLIGIGTIQPALYGAELSASELAQALGVDWWEVRLPGAQSEQFMVSFQLDFGDGRKPKHLTADCADCTDKKRKKSAPFATSR